MSYRNLKAEMARGGITQATVARHLGMTPTNFNLKVNEKVPFTIEEARDVRDRFFPDATLDYLFASDGNVPSAAERAHATACELRDALRDTFGEDSPALASVDAMHAEIDRVASA